MGISTRGRDTRHLAHPLAPSVRRGAFGVWFAAIALVPFYFGASGSLQLADVLFLGVAAILVLSGFRFEARARRAVAFAIAFVAYVVVINLAWSLLLSQRYPLGDLPVWAVPFYVFNGIVVATGFGLASIDPRWFVRTTRTALAVALTVNVAALILAGLGAGRTTLFFNNPNQLGYFAVLASSVFLLTSSRSTRVADSLALAAGLVLAAASLSKAAMVAVLVAGVIAILRGRWLVMLGAMSLVLVASAFSFGDELLERAQIRIEGIGQDGDDNLAGRGYDRIFDRPELVVLGAGEGAYERFETRIEVHSTFGTLVFSYGLVGAILFFGILWTAWGRSGLWVWLASTPIWLYGLTHQGMRARLLWVFVVIGYAVYGAARSRQAGHGSPSDELNEVLR